jgi:hypothetical protein
VPPWRVAGQFYFFFFFTFNKMHSDLYRLPSFVGVVEIRTLRLDWKDQKYVQSFAGEN